MKDMRVVATEILNVYINFEYDVESGLYHLRARHYSPITGTFLSPDPIGFEGGDTNLYGYVFNNSVNLTDPTGEGPIAVLACHLGLGISTVISLYLLSEDTEALDKKISAANEIIYDQNACTERRRKAISQILIND